MLVILNTHTWTGVKTDKGAAETLTDRAGAQRGAAKVNKNLLGNCPELKKIINLRATTRTALKTLTLPWLDNGTRLVPVSRYVRVSDYLVAAQQEFYDAVSVLADVYSDRVAQARVSLGDMFNASEYMDTEEVIRRFHFSFSFSPVPESQDFRCDMAGEAINELRAQYENDVQSVVTQGINETVEAAKSAITYVVERLDRLDATSQSEGRSAPLRASMIHAVQECADRVRDANLADSPALSMLSRELYSLANGLDLETLRASQSVRDEARADIKEIIDNLPSLGF